MTVYILRDSVAAMPPLRKRVGRSGRESPGGNKPELKTFDAYPLGHNRLLNKKYKAYKRV